MNLDERLEIRLTLEEKEAIQLAARRHGMSVSDYVRTCCHQDLLAEIPPAEIKRFYQMGGQHFVHMAVVARAATMKVEEQRSRATRVGAWIPGATESTKKRRSPQ